MENIENVVTLLLNYGALGGCLVYFIFKDKQNQEKALEKQEETNKLIESLKDTITELKHMFEFYIKKDSESK